MREVNVCHVGSFEEIVCRLSMWKKIAEMSHIRSDLCCY